jgi:hypothetical protein
VLDYITSLLGVDTAETVPAHHGEPRWASTVGDSLRASPAVVGGVMYTGTGRRHYAWRHVVVVHAGFDVVWGCL